ncbi:MAG: hypothetical protein K0U68_15775 [Gammaproteobacteria bacterium]|nr:hypothetical protein [Gammaproteobacteria bacterium]
MDTVIQEPLKPERRQFASTFLRWSGALILVVAALHYMIQGLNITSEALRFWVMPGFISFLAMCGLFCGYWLKDPKNTRIFYGLGTAFIAAQLSQVAAMGRALMIKGQSGEVLLDMWWDLDQLSPLVVGSNFVISVLLAVPVVYAGFTMLASQHRKSLLFGFLIANIAMMLPVRDQLSVTAIIVLGFFVLRYRDMRYYQADRAMKTISGFSARLLVWVPLLIVVGRCGFYTISDKQYAVLLAMVAWLLIREIPRIVGKAEFIPLLQYFGLTIAMTAWIVGAHDFIQSFSGINEIYAAILPVSAFLFTMSFRIQDDSPATRFIAAMIAMLTVVCLMLDSSSYVTAMMSLATGLVLTVGGLYLHEKLVLSCGVISFIGGLLYYMSFLLDMYHAMPWLSAGLMGVAALLLASWIDKQEGSIRGKISETWYAVKTW